MHIFCFFHRLLIPALLGNVGVLFLGCHRLRRHQTSIMIIHGNPLKIISVGFIQKIHSLLNLCIFTGEIIFLDGIIVYCIRNPSHASQIIFQIFTRLFHKLSRALNHFFSGCIGKAQIHQRSQNHHDRNGNHRKRKHDGRLDTPGLQLLQPLQIFIAHHPYAPFCTWKEIRQTAV